MIQAVLFDMDGVLVDSEEYICRAAIQMFAEHDMHVKPEDFLPFVGAGEDRYIGGVAKKYNFPFNSKRDKTRTYTLYGEMVSGKLKPLNGVWRFIGQCRQKGLKTAVATSADRVKMEINLKEIDIHIDTFDATVTGIDVARKKPFPDIYVKAAETLHIQPEECLVAEDAVNGVKAAKAAGCKCLALTTSFSPEELHEADWIVADLSEAPIESISW